MCRGDSTLFRFPMVTGTKAKLGMAAAASAPTSRTPAGAPAQPPAKPEAPQLVFKERKTVLDRVKEDGVMKELVRNQEKAQENWERKWGFMKNPRRTWEQEAVKRGLPGDIFEQRDNRRKPASWSVSRMPTRELQASTGVPVLSSGVIGWRSSFIENDLNRIAGPLYVSRVRTMDPPLAPGEPDPKHQRFIFLG